MSVIHNILFLQERVANARDEEAYKTLFLHFYTQLHRLCLNMVKNNEVAEEIVSDVMINIWQMGNKLTEIKDLKLYLLRSIKNASLNYLQKPYHQNVFIEEDYQLMNAISYVSEDKIVFSETKQLIERAVASLPAQCQFVFRLVKEQGLSYSEVSSLLDISLNTIKTHIRLALKRIKNVLEREG